MMDYATSYEVEEVDGTIHLINSAKALLEYTRMVDRRAREDAELEIGRLHEELAAAYIKLSGTDQHASDCATSNAPAMKPGPCDCKENAETFTRSGNV